MGKWPNKKGQPVQLFSWQAEPDAFAEYRGQEFTPEHDSRSDKDRTKHWKALGAEGAKRMRAIVEAGKQEDEISTGSPSDDDMSADEEAVEQEKE